MCWGMRRMGILYRLETHPSALPIILPIRFWDKLLVQPHLLWLRLKMQTYLIAA